MSVLASCRSFLFIIAAFAGLMTLSTFSKAAISYIDSSSVRGNNDRTSVSVPATAVANDLLLAQITYRNQAGGDAITAPAGWTQIGALQSDGDILQAAFYKLATAGDAGGSYRWEFEGSGNRRFVSGMSVYRGVDLTSPVANSGAQDGSFGPVVTAPSVVIANANSALVAFYTVEAGDQSFTASASMTEIYDREDSNTANGITSMASYELNVGAGASGDRAATTTISDEPANGFLVVLNEATTAFPSVDNIGGSCGANELLIVKFTTDVSDAILNPALFTPSVGTVDTVTRQSSDTVILRMSGLVAGQSTTVELEGVDTDVDFQGLLGRYFDHRDGGGNKASPPAGAFTGNEYFRLDSQVNFTWNNATPTIFPGVSGDGDRFSIRWTGSLVPDTAGSYEFRLYSDDGVRLNLDGTEIVNDWSNHAPRYSGTSAPQTLQAGQTYDIQMEHYENTGRAVAQLEWRRDGGAWENIPTANLNTCATATVFTDIAFWNFNQSSWDGTTDEVIDSGPNGYHGTAENGASVADTSPAVAGDPGTCNYGVFDDAGTVNGNYIEVPSFPNLTTDFTISAWIRTEDRSQRGQRIFADDESGPGYALSLGDPGAGRVRFFSRGINPVSLDTNTVIDNDTWYFVAGVADITNGMRTIYVFAEDGTLLETASVAHTGSWAVSTGTASIGGETDSGETQNRFLGNIDSVRISEGALDQATVAALINETQPCNELTPVLEYRFDESAWSGAADEVIDSTANGGSGSAQGGATTIATGHICRAGEFDGTDDYVELGAGTLDDLRSTGSLSFWIQTTQTGNNTGWRAPGIAGVEQAGGSDDIFWGWIDASGRIGLSVGNDYATDTKSTTAINDGAFHHVVLTRNSTTGAYKIYVDGVLEQSETGATGDIGNTFSSIGRIEDTGGSPEYFQGVLDEVKVFDSVLTDQNVTDLYNETRACPGASLAHYAFEQTNLTGPGVIVDDFSGNGRSGISVGDAIGTADGYYCRGITIPNNTTSGEIDAINSRQDINDVMGSEGTIMFWYRSEDAWIGGGERTLMDATIRVTNNAADKYFFLSKENDGQLRFAMEDSADRDFNLRTPAQSFAAQTWVHIAVTYDLPNDELEIYVNGTRAANQTVNSNGVLGELGEIYFGDAQTNYVTPASSANGTMDELKLFVGVLDSAEINAEMNDNHLCGCTLAEFNITQPTYGLACPTPRTSINIQATCADSSVKTDYVGTVDLSTNDNANSEFYLADSGGTAVTSVTFASADAGSKDVYLYHREVFNALTVTADDGSVSTTSASSTEFAANGFVASSPTSFACGASTAVTLTAVGQDPAGTGSCVRLTGFDGDFPIKAWSEINIDPSESPGVADTGLPNQMSINGGAIASSQPGVANLTVAFDQGQASLNLAYLDAGEILEVNLRHDQAPYDGATDPAITPLVATLDRFIVYPSTTEVSANSASAICSEADPSDCDDFTSAGSNFGVTTRAVCTDNSTALSYQGTVGFTHSLVAPSPGNLGTIGQGDVTISTNGQAVTNNQSLSEVGVFDLSMQATTYFDETVAASSPIRLGRFVPDDFNLTTTNGTFADECVNTPGDDFTYVGQPFGYDAAPTLRIEAINAGGVTVENYTHVDFRKLSAANVLAGITFPTQGTHIGADGTALAMTTTSTAEGTLTVDGANPGFMDYTFGAHTYVYTKEDNALITTFDSTDETITISQTALTDGEASATAGSLVSWTPTVGEHRYGRWRIENVFGPENETLKMLSQAEYFDGNGFILNDIDTCTSIQNYMTVRDSDGDEVTLTGGEYPDIEVGGGETTLTFDDPIAGDGNFNFSPPGNDGTGSSVTVELDFGTDDWLQFDWFGTGLANPEPRTATFGQYRGHDRIIYWREVR